jgi:hypothetical protein
VTGPHHAVGMVGPADATALLAGLLALLTGLAYTALGVITALDLATGARARGVRLFGVGFLLMASTCGPHHLVHATHLLVEGERASRPLLTALAVGAPPAALFVVLRLEAVLGGRGDRLVRGTPVALVVAPGLLAAAAGAIALAGFQRAAAHPPELLALAPNVVLFAAYLLVGACILRTQVARRPALGGWSVSGVSMSAVFITCGLSHLVAGATLPADLHSALFDLPGVPASLFFLWVVHGLHRASQRDWNRRPLVGAPARRPRTSPWGAGSAS